MSESTEAIVLQIPYMVRLLCPFCEHENEYGMKNFALYMEIHQIGIMNILTVRNAVKSFKLMDRIGVRVCGG